jgi:hypothetical protein
MITTALEKLVLSGKASFNTYVIGGAEKYVLNVESDRFIIITGITYFSRINGPAVANSDDVVAMQKNCLTQLRVFSSKSNNLFTFRDSYNISATGPDAYFVMPIGSTQLNTYLIHESDVSFTFAAGGGRSQIVGNFPTDTPANFPPYDYGSGTDPRVIPVVLQSQDSSLTSIPTGLNNLIPGPYTSEFTIPVDPGHVPVTAGSYNYPLVHIQYVEILGNPTNIAATL